MPEQSTTPLGLELKEPWGRCHDVDKEQPVPHSINECPDRRQIRRNKESHFGPHQDQTETRGCHRKGAVNGGPVPDTASPVPGLGNTAAPQWSVTSTLHTQQCHAVPQVLQSHRNEQSRT